MKATSSGSVRASFELGRLYLEELKGTDREDEVISLIKYAAAHGHKKAQIMMSEDPETQHSKTAAREEEFWKGVLALRNLSGFIEFELGLMFESGLGVEKDLLQAFHCFHSAAKMEHKAALIKVSEYNDLFFEMSFPDLYENPTYLAAEQGNGGALREIAETEAKKCDLYYDDPWLTGPFRYTMISQIKSEILNACYLYRVAAFCGDKEAQRITAEFYHEEGMGAEISDCFAPEARWDAEGQEVDGWEYTLRCAWFLISGEKPEGNLVSHLRERLSPDQYEKAEKIADSFVPLKKNGFSIKPEVAHIQYY